MGVFPWSELNSQTHHNFEYTKSEAFELKLSQEHQVERGRKDRERERERERKSGTLDISHA